MQKRKLKTHTLYILAALLAVIAAAVIVADCFIGKLYSEQRKNLGLSAEAAPVPVISASPTPVITDQPTPTPEPTRKPLFGDLLVPNFPEYDTGENADYSYQSDELRIAVTRVQDVGVTYFVADIWMRNISCYRTAFANDKYRGKRQDPEEIAKNSNSILAVNGDFLGGLAIRNGKKYSVATERLMDEEVTPTPDYFEMVFATPTPTPRPERSTCVLYKDGRMVTEEFKTFRTTRAMKEGAWQGWQFGPTLVRNGKPTDDVKNQGRNPRCMLGYYEPGHYCIVVIDGRQKDYSVGMNFGEMTDLAMSLGLQEAYNLDGGGSAVMTFNGKVISSPSGKGDTRRLPDMVVIGEYLSAEELTLFAPPTPEITSAAVQ